MRASLVNLERNAADGLVENTAPGIDAPLTEVLEELNVTA